MLSSDSSRDIQMNDLGKHMLPDLMQSEQIYECIYAADQPASPPLKSLPSSKHNLPSQICTFIGRDDDRRQIKAELQSSRLVTLVGVGGCGKTRLALQTAAELTWEYQDGIWFIELAPLQTESDVTKEMFRVLQCNENFINSPIQTLTEAISDKQMLLVLDNMEHLLPVCIKLVEALLKSCPSVHIIATSREPLQIIGEKILRVRSLSLPPMGSDLSTILSAEAVTLFTERARDVAANFTIDEINAGAMERVCRRLDGIPFAIELAAARMRAMSAQEIEKRLDNRFKLLTGGSREALPRQQTLRALMDWSYDLLSEKEKRLIANLSVFQGGWKLEAAEAVASCEEIESWEIIDLLTSLVDKSMIVFDYSLDNPRYKMLETVKQYATEKALEDSSIDLEMLRRKHLKYFLELSEDAKKEIKGANQLHWYTVLNSEIDNIRTALDEGLKLNTEEDLQDVRQLAQNMSTFWTTRAYTSEAISWIQKILDRVGEDNSETKCKLLSSLGTYYELRGALETAKEYQKQSLAIAQAMDNLDLISLAHVHLGTLESKLGNYQEARKYYKIVIDSDWGEKVNPYLGTIRHNMGILAYFDEDYDEAETIFNTVLELRKQQNDALSEARTLLNLGMIANARENAKKALASYQEAFSILTTLGDKEGIGTSLNSIGSIYNQTGELYQALDCYYKSLKVREEISDLIGLGTTLLNIARIQLDLGNIAETKEFLSNAETVVGACNDKRNVLHMLVVQTDLDIREQNYEKAREHCISGLALTEETGLRANTGTFLTRLAEIEIYTSNIEKAKEILNEAVQSCKNIKTREGEVYAIFDLTYIALLQYDTPSAFQYLAEVFDYPDAYSLHELITTYTTLASVQGELYPESAELFGILDNLYQTTKAGHTSQIITMLADSRHKCESSLEAEDFRKFHSKGLAQTKDSSLKFIQQLIVQNAPGNTAENA